MEATAIRFYECDIQAQSCTVADLATTMATGKRKGLQRLATALRGIIFNLL